MKIVQLVKISVVIIGIASLAACAKKPKPEEAPYGAEQGMAGGAQAYSEAGEAGFRVDANGKRINPLRAPANQAYYFSYDSNAIDASDEQAMGVQASYLVSHPSAKIRLEGNTDNHGSREYNIGLGWRRDQAVATYLKQQGVKSSQIQMLSNGKEKPVAMGDDERSRSLNRRVDLIYVSY